MKKLLITICGRAGSKGFKNKNLKTFCGRPLVYYSLAAAGLFQASRPDVQVDICLNTDSEALAKLVAEQYPEVVYLPRCEELGGDRVESALGAEFAFGVLRGRRVAVACCGVGKVNAAACATWLLCARGCGLILNAGIAGAVGHGLRTLDVVASRELCFHDQDPVMLKYFPKRRLFAGDPGLWALCRRACARPGVLQGAYREGRVATGDRFVADRATRDRIAAACAPDCVEMEGAAIAQACWRNRVPFVILRSISDNADGNAGVSYAEFSKKAAGQAVRLLSRMLKTWS